MTHDEKKKSEELFDEFSQNAGKEDITKIASKLDGMKKGPVAESLGPGYRIMEHD